jgi:hypothetical protein
VPTVPNYRELETAVQAAGPSWTILRFSSGLADGLARDLVSGQQTGEFVAPAKDAHAIPAAIIDLAAAAAIVPAARQHDGEVLEFAGPDDLGWGNLANGAGVPFRAVSDDDNADCVMERFGWQLDTIALLTALYADFRAGWSRSTGTLSDILGRAAAPGLAAVTQRVARFRCVESSRSVDERAREHARKP